MVPGSAHQFLKSIALRLKANILEYLNWEVGRLWRVCIVWLVIKKNIIK